MCAYTERIALLLYHRRDKEKSIYASVYIRMRVYTCFDRTSSKVASSTLSCSPLSLSLSLARGQCIRRHLLPFQAKIRAVSTRVLVAIKSSSTGNPLKHVRRLFDRFVSAEFRIVQKQFDSVLMFHCCGGFPSLSIARRQRRREREGESGREREWQNVML